MDLKIKKKIVVMFALFSLVFLIVVARLAWIIVIDGDVLRAEVDKLKRFDRDIYSERGNILDRNGQLLAYSKSRYKIALNRKGLKPDGVDEHVEMLAEVLSISEEEIRGILQASDKSNVDITYIYDKNMARQLAILPTNRVWVDEEFVRVYPNGSLASQVVGITQKLDSYNALGTYGIEKQFDDFLTGTDGVYITQVDGRNNELVYSEAIEVDKVDGYDIELTIDSVIQYYLESALKTGFERENPINAHGLVLNVKTGEILAMASYPTFDANNRQVVGVDQADLQGLSLEESGNTLFRAMTNKLVTDFYELGSVVKLLTTALALEGDYYTPDSYFDEGNITYVSGESITCWKYPGSHPPGSLTEAVANSCNPVFVEIFRTMGSDAIFDGFGSFGLFDRTGVELPAEANGYFGTKETSVPFDVATMTFGHGASYTPLKMAIAMASLVNGGDLMTPQIVHKVTDDQGNLVYEQEPVLVRKVISEITSEQMKDIMEFVVDSGAADQVLTPGLRVGAKTGTSEKIVEGAYSSEHTIASMVAVAPMEDPEIMIYVLLDEPESYQGSSAAGPVVKEILDEISEYLEFEKTFDVETALAQVPDVLGLSLEAGGEILTEAGFEYSLPPGDVAPEDLIIINQYPKAGVMRNTGQKIILELMQR